MRTELYDYCVFPRVVLSGEATEIQILPRGRHAAFSGEVQIELVPMHHTTEGTRESFPVVTATAEANGSLRFRWRFEGEQEYALNFKSRRGSARLSVFCAEADLFALRGFRGDLHVHTCMSDGKESPEYVPAKYREMGFDFLAITDHRQYAPSLEAIRAYENLPCAPKLFPGEEVHAPDNHTHIVNFAGSISVNDWFTRDEAAYRAEVAARMAGEAVPEGVNAFEYAANCVLFDKIREGGGLAIFPHPHWRSHSYHVDDAMTWRLFKNRPFDAFELLGGMSCQENNMQTMIWAEARAQGMQIPVVGSSDSHGTVNAVYFTEESTIALAPSLQRDALVGAIRAGQSVAVERYMGEEPRVYGEYRYARYARFLLDEYFPQHDELCRAEGLLLAAAVQGDASARNALEALAGRTDAFRERCFGKA